MNRLVNIWVVKFVLVHLGWVVNVVRRVFGEENIVIHLDVKVIHNQYQHKIIIFDLKKNSLYI